MASARRDARFCVSTLRSSNSRSREKIRKISFLQNLQKVSKRPKGLEGPAYLNRSRSAHSCSWALRLSAPTKIEYDIWKRLADTRPYASRHSTLDSFNFLRQFVAEKSFRPNKEKKRKRVGLMAPVGFEPTTNGLCLPLRLSPRSDPFEPEFVVWTISSLYVSAI